MEDTSEKLNETEHRSRKRIMLYLLICLLSSVFVGFLYTLLLEWCVSGDFSFIGHWIFDQTISRNYFFSVILISVLTITLYCFLTDFRWTVLLEGIVLLVLAEAEIMKYDVRRELLHYQELFLQSLIKTGTHSVKITISPRVVIGLVVVVLFFVLSSLLQKKLNHLIDHFSFKERIMCIALGLVMAVIILPSTVDTFYYSLSEKQTIMDVLDAGKKEDNQVLYRFLYRNNGNIGNEAAAYKTLLWMIEENEEKQQQQDLDQETESGQYPNVIVIMAESLWDLSKLEGENVHFSESPMEPLRKYEARFGKGSIYTNIQGGGTVSTEAQFLLGINTKYAASAAVYGCLSSIQQDSIPSIVEYFKELQYKTVAIHPYYGGFYERDVVYQKLGFDDVYFSDDMKYRDRTDLFISDESFSKEVIERYQEKDDRPLFMFGVTVGAHGKGMDYEAPEQIHQRYTIIPETSYELDRDEMRQLTHYANCIHETGEAFDMLVNCFSQTEEPTIIVMFGDHIPNFPEKVVENSQLTDLEKYETPVYMWNNFGGQKMLEDSVDATYLSSIMLDYLNMPTCNMIKINQLLMNHYQYDIPIGAADVNGQSIQQYTPYDEELLKNIRTIDNAMLRGGESCRDIWEF